MTPQCPDDCYPDNPPVKNGFLFPWTYLVLPKVWSTIPRWYSDLFTYPSEVLLQISMAMLQET